jgi:hypothetical protein
MIIAVFNKTDGVVAATYPHVVQILDDGENFILRSDIESFSRSFSKKEFSYYNISGVLDKLSANYGNIRKA